MKCVGPRRWRGSYGATAVVARTERILRSVFSDGACDAEDTLQFPRAHNWTSAMTTTPTITSTPTTYYIIDPDLST